MKLQKKLRLLCRLLLLIVVGANHVDAQGDPLLSWSKIAGPWGGSFDGRFGSIAVHPTNPSIIFIGSSVPGGPGVFKSSDGGGTWVAKNAGIALVPLTSGYPLISKIVFSPSNPDILYLGAASDFPGGVGYVYRSADGGETWQQARGQIGIISGYQIGNPVFDLDVDPQHPFTVYAAVAGQGVMKTTNGGADWSNIFRSAVAENEVGYVNAVRVSPVDSGTVFFTYFLAIAADVVPIFIPGENPRVHSIGTAGILPSLLYKSTNGGATWTTLAGPSEPAAITDLQYERASGNWYVSTIAYQTPLFFHKPNYGLFKSSDSGQSWQAINQATFGSLDQMPFVAISTNQSNVNKGLFASAGFGNLIVASTDSGGHWVRLDPCLLSAYIGHTAVAGNKLFALTTVGTFFTDISSLYVAAKPAIASLSPSTLPPSSSAQSISIYGTDFKGPADPNASKLVFYDPANNPTPLRTPEFVETGQLNYSATLPVAGTWKVKVVNGSVESVPYSFTVASGTTQLTGLSISGPTNVGQNGSGQYTATAIYNDGSTPTVTASWSLNAGAPASMSTSGQLTAGSVSANTVVTVSATFISGNVTKTATYEVSIRSGTPSYQLLELITNGTFISGNASWATTGNFQADTRFNTYNNEPGYGYLSNFDGTSGNNLSGTLSQTISIPANATDVALGYYVRITSTEAKAGASDLFVLNLILSGGSFATLDSKSNLDANLGYAFRPFNLTSYKGQTVTLRFAASTDVSGPTVFRVDDVSVLANVPVPPTEALFGVSGPTLVAEGRTAQYNAIVVFSDGSVQPVTPNWNVSGPATISSSGTLIAGSVSGDTTATVIATRGSSLLNYNVTIKNVAPVLSSLAISGPSSIVENGSAAFTATAILSDGSPRTVSPIWSVTSGPGSIVDSGVLTVGDVGSDTRTTVVASYASDGLTRGASQDVTIVNVPPPPTLSSLTVSGPILVDENSAAQYSATAWFSDGSSQVANPTWNVDAATTSISTFGLLSAGEVTSDTSVTVSASHTVGGITQNTQKSVTLINKVTAPAFTIQPVSRLVIVSNFVTFAAAASATPTPSYQWQYSVNGGSSWSDVPTSSPYSGVATGTLTITGVTIGMDGYLYRCMASNSVASTLSYAARLTINSLATVNLDAWTWRNPLPQGNRLPGIAWSGRQYVAVGDAGSIVTSADGVLWVNRQSGTTKQLWGVTWNGSTFVAVGDVGTILTSSDGISWTSRSPVTSNMLFGVAWSGSQFVAVGFNGTTLTSTDGANWTSRSSGSTSWLYAVTWTGSQFVAVGYPGTILTSSDGVTWTNRSIGTTDRLRGVASSGSRLVAVGASGTILTSTDGATWTSRDLSTTNGLWAATWNGTEFIAVGDEDTILTSTDGIAWTARGPTPGMHNLYGIVSNSGGFVATGFGEVLTSPDGLLWTNRLLGTTTPLNSLTWSGSQFVAVGDRTILMSPDGVTWTSRNTADSPTCVTWDGSQFIAVGTSNGAGSVLTSADGVDWTSHSAGTASSLNGVTWSGSQFVAVGSSGAILTSANGVDWTNRSSGTNVWLNRVTWSGNEFVAVGDLGTILTSTDGVAWISRDSGTSKQLFAVASSGSEFVAVGDGTILTSTNGVSWTSREPSMNGWLLGAMWTGSQFVVVGIHGILLTSVDGVTWTNRNSGTTNALYDVTSSGNEFVIVGDIGTILIAGPGRKADQTISFAAPTDKTYGDAPFALSASVSSGLPVSFSILSGPATINPATNTVTISGAGTVTIRASQSGNAAYTAAADVEHTFIVAKKILTIAADSKSRAYGAANPTLTVSSYTGFANSDTPGSLTTLPSASTSAGATSGVASYAITPSGAVSLNYSFSYVDGTLTVTKATLTAKADDKIKALGAVNPPLTISYAGFVNGDTATVIDTLPTVSTTAVTGSPAGTYPITLTGGSDNNYALMVQGGTLTVTAKTLQTITFAALADKTYGNATFALSATASSSLHVTFTVVSGPATLVGNTVSITGSGAVTIRAGQAGDATFAVAPDVEHTFNVTKAALTVTADNKSRIYGAANPALTFAVTGFVNGDSSAVVTGTPALSTTAIATSAVGPHPITAEVGTLAAANYTFSFASGTLTVTQAPLTARADDKSKQPGAANPALTISYTGFVNGETAAVIDTPPTASTTAVTGSPAGTYPITLSGGADNNYTLTVQNGTLTVTTKTTQTITFSALADKTYGNTPFALTATATSGLPVTFVVVSGPATRSGNLVTITGVGTVTVRAEQAGDATYAAAAPVERSFVVTKGLATVSLSDLVRLFDGIPKVATALTTPAGLTVSIIYNGTTIAPSAEGEYPVVATIVDPNYAGMTTGTLVISPVVVAPLPEQVIAGSPIRLRSTIAGNATAFRWQVRPHLARTMSEPSGNGTADVEWVDIHGATGAELTIPAAQRSDDADYRVIATINGTEVTSEPVVVVVAEPPPNNARLLNLSTRAQALSGDDVLIPGFVVRGTGSKRLLIRAVGPTLGKPPFDLAGVLPDPRMRLFKRNPTTTHFEEIAANDNWGTNTNATAITQTAADLFAFAFNDTLEAALLMNVEPGEYTVIAGGVNGVTGLAIVELYDADTGTPGARLVNISNRGFAGVSAQVMIPGFVVSSEGPKTLLVRVVGPTLGSFGVPGTMADPKLEVFPGGASTPILTNDNWGDNPDAAYTAQIASQVLAFPLTAGSKDAAFVVTLQPGAYTVVGSSALAGGTGVVLVEVYVVP